MHSALTSDRATWQLVLISLTCRNPSTATLNSTIPMTLSYQLHRFQEVLYLILAQAFIIIQISCILGLLCRIYLKVKLTMVISQRNWPATTISPADTVLISAQLCR